MLIQTSNTNSIIHAINETSQTSKKLTVTGFIEKPVNSILTISKQYSNKNDSLKLKFILKNENKNNDFCHFSLNSELDFFNFTEEGTHIENYSDIEICFFDEYYYITRFLQIEKL